jgi:hypothetical protein
VLALSETTTPRRIEARFRSRRVGKIWRYSEQTLGETPGACIEHYERVPMVSEFDWLRERELQLAAAMGNDTFHIPQRDAVPASLEDMGQRVAPLRVLA